MTKQSHEQGNLPRHFDSSTCISCTHVFTGGVPYTDRTNDPRLETLVSVRAEASSFQDLLKLVLDGTVYEHIVNSTENVNQNAVNRVDKLRSVHNVAGSPRKVGGFHSVGIKNGRRPQMWSYAEWDPDLADVFELSVDVRNQISEFPQALRYRVIGELCVLLDRILSIVGAGSSFPFVSPYGRSPNLRPLRQFLRGETGYLVAIFDVAQFELRRSRKSPFITIEGVSLRQ